MRISSLGFYLPFLFFFPFSICFRSNGRQLGLSPPPGPWCGILSPCAHYLHLCAMTTAGSVTTVAQDRNTSQQDSREPLRKSERATHYGVFPPTTPTHPQTVSPLPAQRWREKRVGFKGGHLAPEVIAGIVPSLTPTSSPSPAHSVCFLLTKK